MEGANGSCRRPRLGVADVRASGLGGLRTRGRLRQDRVQCGPFGGRVFKHEHRCDESAVAKQRKHCPAPGRGQGRRGRRGALAARGPTGTGGRVGGGRMGCPVCGNSCDGRG